MIIIKYKGGLGNQMFQYALHQILEQIYDPNQIKADLSHYILQNEHNGFELTEVFHFNKPLAALTEVKKIANVYLPGRLYPLLPPKLQRRISSNIQYKLVEVRKKLCKSRYKHHYSQRFHNTYEEEIFHLDMSCDWYLDGLWQNLSYWKHIWGEEKDAIARMQGIFSFREERYLANREWKALAEGLSKPDTVAIHVRRGDFANSKFDICPREYYEQAIRKIQEKIPQPSFFFFTDDIGYVQTAFFLQNMTIIANGPAKAEVDMWLMSKAGNLIISNSTFSYWGALLNQNKEKLVIAPKYSIKSQKGEFLLSAPADWWLIDNLHG